MEQARSGQLNAAIADVRRLLQRGPRDLDVMQALSLLLMQAGEVEQAMHHLSRAVQMAPGVAALRNNLAGMLMRTERFAEAAQQLEQAVRLQPENPQLWMNLSCSLLQVPDAEGAVRAAREGMERSGGSPDIAVNLAMALEKSGRIEEAVDVAARAHAAHPGNTSLHSQYLYMLNATERPAEEIAKLHREFGDRRPTNAAPTASDQDPARPLRVGWLTGDFRTHSVAFFAEPLLAGAPPWAEMHVFAVSTKDEDPITKRFRGYARSWMPVEHLNEEALARTIREHRIDILIETNGHTGGNRLAALALKPAPIIVTAIGYPNTTGLPAVDYRVVDSITDPPGAESLSTERLLRIDPCFLCFRAAAAPEPVDPPVDAPVTFGSFNVLHKIGPLTARLWRGVLERVPGSRLVLKAQDLRDAGIRAGLLARLGAAGVDTGRIDLLPGTDRIREHLGMYSRMHIALDTSPYNGTTTTCEAMWMGVPVVVLEGDRHQGRVGLSLLNAVGKREWIARTPEEYVAVAAELASDRARLQGIRSSLRERVRGSVLCDEGAYVARFYGALRGCWREWCGRR